MPQGFGTQIEVGDILRLARVPYIIKEMKINNHFESSSYSSSSSASSSDSSNCSSESSIESVRN